MSYNKVIIVGNLTRDPELKSFPNGTSVCRISVGMSRKYAGKDGRQVVESCFVDAAAFGRQAENIAKHFVKGKEILIEGRLRQDTWTDKNGERRSKLLVAVDTFSFTSGNAPERARGDAVSPASRHPDADFSAEGDDEDMPF